ncbi:MAG: hypothetical protein ACE14V_12155 [bacterium]
MQKKGLLVLIIFLFCVSIGYGAILISNQSATYGGASTLISFRMNTYGFVTVYIKDAATGTTIKEIAPGFLSPLYSTITVYWDGTKTSGGSATTGDYYITIEAIGNPVNAGYKPLRLTPISFTNAAGIAFNKNTADIDYFGRLYVTDYSTDSISMFYPDGLFIRRTTAGQAWGAFGPYGIDIDTKSVVWINDRSFQRTRLFTSELTYLRDYYAGGLPKMDICVTGDTTSGALYMVWDGISYLGVNTSTRIEKAKITNGVFDAFQFICPTSVTTTMRSILATQDNTTLYTAQVEAAPAVKQFTGSNYSYTQTGWSTAVDTAFALDFTPDGQYLWVSSWDTAANLKKVRISDGTIVDSFVIDTSTTATYPGCIAVDLAGNIAVLYGNKSELGKPLMNIYQPPDSGSRWVANTEPFHFNSLGNIPPSVDSSSANPYSIPSNGITPSLITVYITDADRYTDDTSVYLDLTSIGGSATYPMVLQNYNTNFSSYTTSITATAGSAVGVHALPVYVVDSGGNIASGTVNLYVTAGFISGMVTVDSSTVGISGAIVSATGGTGPYTVISGTGGAYVLDAAVGSYTVSASKTGWDAGTVQSGVNVVQGSTTGSINVTLIPKTIAVAKTLPMPINVAISGVVLAPRGRFTVAPYGLNNQFYIADEGNPTGVRVVIDDTDPLYPRMGDRVVVEGDLATVTGFNEMRLAATFAARIGSGKVVAPTQIIVTDVATTSYGKFIALSNVTVNKVVSQPYYSNYTVANNLGKVLVYYDTNSTVSDQVLPLPSQGANVTVTGIISQQVAGIYTSVIRPWYISQISIAPNSTLLVPTQTLTFNASGGTSPYIWYSNNPTIGSIDSTSGLFTALSNGTCSITVTDAVGGFGWAYIIIHGTSAPLVTEPNNCIYSRYSRENIDGLLR